MRSANQMNEWTLDELRAGVASDTRRLPTPLTAIAPTAESNYCWESRTADAVS
jgi:hypothetical protein